MCHKQKHLYVIIALPSYSVCAAKTLNKQPLLFLLSLLLVLALHQKFGICENWSFYDISPKKVITLLLWVNSCFPSAIWDC